jgi:hypothetical protein
VISAIPARPESSTTGTPVSAGPYELGHLLEAGGRVDEGRVAGHRVGNPDIVDVLAVGYDVGDVGVGDDPGRLAGLVVEDHQRRHR